MASNRARGKAFEKKIADYLTSIGWKVQRAPSQAKWIGPGRMVSVASDFFGCVDIMAIHPKQPFTLFIQATLGHDRWKKMKDLEEVPWNIMAQRVQVWQKIKESRRDIRVMVKDPDATDGWKEYIFPMIKSIWPAGTIIGEYRSIYDSPHTGLPQNI